MSQYDGFIVAEINPFKNTIRFTNDIELTAGSYYGNMQESDIRKIQIRETIISHFEKEEKLFNDNIKTLSLFLLMKLQNIENMMKMEIKYKVIMKKYLKKNIIMY